MPWTTEVVETVRLRLRPFREDDKPVILELTTDPDVRRHLGGPVTDPAALDALRAAVVPCPVAAVTAVAPAANGARPMTSRIRLNGDTTRCTRHDAPRDRPALAP